jgi:hypothetical protein
MVNCTVTVYKDVDKLDHGHRREQGPASTTLYQGPAYLSAPARNWEREAALEGVYAGEVHVHTHVNLNPATRVVVAGHDSAGEYQVLGAAVTSREWRLSLGRRP